MLVSREEGTEQQIKFASNSSVFNSLLNLQMDKSFMQEPFKYITYYS